MKILFKIITCFFLFVATTNAQLEICPLFSDHAVLQRNQPIKIWGWAHPRTEVVLVFKGRTYMAAPDGTGKWTMVLPAMKAGGPYEMEINAGPDKINLKDILIGDVWLCSGQSNMEWVVSNTNNAEKEIATANDNKIRHFKVPRSFSEKPGVKLAGGEWQKTNSENVGDFTAVGYYFAKEIRKVHDVPIGLLNSSWGGSRIEPWMSAGSLDLENVESIVAERMEKAKAEREKWQQDIILKSPGVSIKERGMINGEAIWAATDLNDGNWTMVEVPGLWEDRGYAGFDGLAWYRTEFNLTKNEIENKIEIGLGKIDDSDITYVNGQRVGFTAMAWDKERIYEVPAEYLKEGKNILAVRVEDTGGAGGIYGTDDLLFIKTNSRQFDFPKIWKFKLDAFLNSEINFIAHHTPTLLYNKMIYPIIDFPIKGALWYQGESNAENKEDAFIYRKLFADMIRLWRADWNIGDFPFLYVQLANFMEAPEKPAESNWAILRESQTEVLKEKNTGQVVIIDIGEADDIHPRNKQDVGLRLSYAARKLGYGEGINYSSPMYKSHEINEGKIIISFDHIGDGLIVKNKYGHVNGFAIAGGDGKFEWANAILENNKITVWNDEIHTPKYIRYGWADNPDDLNLYNSDGLPVCPFRAGE